MLEHDINIQIWPARVPGKKVKAEELTDHSGGVGGGYNTATGTAYLPTEDNAYERTIRLHESLHALYTERKPAPHMIDQAIEDARLHLNYAKTSGEPRRDELAVAIHDMRQVRREGGDQSYFGPSRDEINDMNLLMMLRSMAIFRHGAKPEIVEKLRARTEKRVGRPVWDKLDSALDAIQCEDIDEAKRILSSEFRNVVAKPQTFRGGAGSGKGAKSGAELNLGELYGAVKEGLLTTDALDFLSPATRRQLEKEWKELPKLAVHDLSHVNSFKTYEGPSDKMLMAGAHIRAKKLAVAAVSPVPVRIFRRKVKLEGGSILIDASGSMSIDDDVLLAIAEAIPFGTIGYYSAPNDYVNHGDLVIYAKNGRRHSIPVGDPMPHHGHGNVVDYPALQWLIKQDPKRYYVGDGGFTGSRINRLCATDLLNNASARKQIKWVSSLPALFAELPDAAFDKLPAKVQAHVDALRAAAGLKPRGEY